MPIPDHNPDFLSTNPPLAKSKINLTNIFKASPWQQIKNTVKTEPKWSLIWSLSSIACSIVMAKYMPKTFYCSIAIGSLGGLHLAAFALEYRRVLPFKPFNSHNPLKPYAKAKPSFRKSVHFAPAPNTNVILAELAYHQDTPFLKIFTNDPKMQGEAISNIMYYQIGDIFPRYYNLIYPILRKVHIISHIALGRKHPYADGFQQYLKKQCAEINFSYPKEKELEIAAIVKTINSKIQARNAKYIVQHEEMTVAQIKLLMQVPDLFKLLACSTGVRKTAFGQELLTNFDYESLGMTEKHTIVIIKPTSNINSYPLQNTPNAYMSFSLTPGLIHRCVVNAQNLVIVMNDATSMSSKRHNSHGYPQLVLIEMLIQNCSTIAEIENFLQIYQPATSHLLIVMDKTNSAVFQILPNDGTSTLFNVRRMQGEYLSVTNHFIDTDGKFVKDSQSWLTSAARFETMEQGFQQNKAGFDILHDVQCAQTIHSLIFNYDKVNDLLTVQFKWKNTYAADKDNIIHTINISEHFKEFKEKYNAINKLTTEVSPKEHPLVTKDSNVNLEFTPYKSFHHHKSTTAFAENLADSPMSSEDLRQEQMLPQHGQHRVIP